MSKQLPLFAQAEQPVTTHAFELYIDGAARGNPGPAGIGLVITTQGKPIEKAGFFIGTKTNNQAEYLALIIAAIMLKKHAKMQDAVIIHSDSELLVKQMTGSYRVKDTTLQQLFRTAYFLMQPYRVTFKHVMRTDNKHADAMANLGIDTHKELPQRYKQVLNEYKINV